MTISQALAAATSALTALHRQAATTSNNVANAMTPGYSRREIALAERALGGAGAGVSIVGVVRAAAPAITAERRAADADAARDKTEAEAARRLVELLGGPEDAGSLFRRFAALESALRALADSPENAAAQLKIVAAAKDLAGSLNTIAARFQQSRADADAEIGRRVADVNRSLEEIEALNLAIMRGAAGGGDVSALLDKRAALVDRINQSIPVREIIRGSGQIDLMTPEGVFLYAGSPRFLEFSPASAMAATLAYAGGAGALSGLKTGGVDITPGGPSPQSLRSGAFAGLFAVRDRIVPDAAQKLDALAQDLIERFSAPGLDPTLPPGAPGLFTDAGAPFDPLVLVGLAGRIAINLAVDPAAGGLPWRLRDGLGAIAPGPAGSDDFIRELIAAMTATRTPAPGLGAAADLSASAAAAHIASLASASLVGAEARQESSLALAQSLADAETQKIGVDTDREMQMLLVIEMAYAANARVIEAVDAMIERLTEL